MVEELSEDLMLELYRQSKVLVIQCVEGADGETRGVTAEDQVALEMYNAVKELAGFDGKGPLVILRTIETKEE